eukprot:SAG31_NODE_1543_length_7944_cov_8.711281_10_plen_194_part_01
MSSVQAVRVPSFTPLAAAALALLDYDIPTDLWLDPAQNAASGSTSNRPTPNIMCAIANRLSEAVHALEAAVARSLGKLCLALQLLQEDGCPTAHHKLITRTRLLRAETKICSPDFSPLVSAMIKPTELRSDAQRLSCLRQLTLMWYERSKQSQGLQSGVDPQQALVTERATEPAKRPVATTKSEQMAPLEAQLG